MLSILEKMLSEDKIEVDKRSNMRIEALCVPNGDSGTLQSPLHSPHKIQVRDKNGSPAFFKPRSEI